MPARHHLVLLVCLLLSPGLWAQAVGGGAAPAKLPPGIAWQPGYERGLALARAEKKPVMVAFLLAGEPANEEIMRLHFNDPQIIKESRRFICLAACLGLKGQKEGIRADGTTGKVSTKLGSATPNEIARTEIKARGALMSAPTVSAPQFIFLAPDGDTVLLRHVWMLSPGDLLKKMRMAYAYFDPSTAPPGFKEHKDQVSRLLQEADSNNQTTRRNALKALAMTDDPRVATFLIDQTRAKAGQQKKLEAVYFMRAKGNAKVLPRLHELLKAKDSLVRLHAAVALEGIGMRESGPHLLRALKREDKDRVRSHMLRALPACVHDEKQIEKIVLKALRARPQLDRLTALHLLQNLEATRKVKSALKAAIKDRSTQIRCAAYVAIVHMDLKELAKAIKARIKSERGPALDCAKWALARLTGEEYETETDHEEEVLDLLPDNWLYEGSLEDPNPNRPRRGGRGGGRGGGGGGGRR